jgi:hypothetical protein
MAFPEDADAIGFREILKSFGAFFRLNSHSCMRPEFFSFPGRGSLWKGEWIGESF